MKNRMWAAALCALGVATGALAGPLEGRWELVEQSYGKGAANLVAPAETKLVLELAREGAGLVARVQVGDETPRRWPVFPEQRADAEVLERAIAADERAMRARYRVPGAGDGVMFEIVESYRIENDALVGTVDVVFVENGQRTGSYRMHRRFERAR